MTVSVERNRRRGIAAVASAAWLAACSTTPPTRPPLLADTSGTREVAGLSAPARVVRDRWGIPHIYAQTTEDLFLAQGFVQAQDRLFQMDLWRRSALGRLAEVLGSNFADRDATTRRIQYDGDIALEWQAYPPETRAIAEAFVRGVNAWVTLARAQPPEEFVLAGWTPDFWAPEDLLNRTDAFVASGDAIEEVFRARLVAAVGARRAADLLPQRAVEMPRGLDPALVGAPVADEIRSVGAPPFFLGLAAIPAVPRGDAVDSDARRTDVPLDVRTLPAPSLHYLVHLHAPGWNVAGATPPWLPGVADGHNDRVSWRSEPVEIDTQDVFVERVNPANQHQVDDNGRWVDTVLTKDALAVRRRDKPLMIDRERTRHGAVLAVDRERHLAFAVRWAGAEPGAASALVALEIDRAASADAVRTAIARWKAPVRRITFADVDGRRGSELAGIVPVRRGWSGALPAPAWTNAYDWTGWRRPAAPDPASPLQLLARRYPDRADALIRDLRDATRPTSPAPPRAVLLNVVADALREAGAPRSAALFAHPLAITEATRRRFNIGPLRPDAADPREFAIDMNPEDWDGSTVVNAPGQSGSPSSAHYADFVRAWKDGSTAPLLFSDAAVAAGASATLTLTPPRGSGAR